MTMDKTDLSKAREYIDTHQLDGGEKSLTWLTHGFWQWLSVGHRLKGPNEETILHVG